ncbi:Uncharacterised protein [uncultured archaeon]|nr:Uncharacterised protein [uncultured archaeon]
MTELIENNKLIELVIEKHKKFLDIYNTEFSGITGKMNTLKQQSDNVKKEIETAEAKILVLNEKYYLLFHQAKKLREEIFNMIQEKMRAAGAASVQEAARISGKIEEFEKKLQNTKNIEEEEKIIVEMKKLLYEFESAARKAGITITCKGIPDKLNEANFSHKELLSLQNKPKQDKGSMEEYGKQIRDIEGRYNWLKHRIESHNTASAYWEKQKAG